MNWPENLKLDPGARKALEEVPQQHPVLANWVEDQKFRDAPDVQAIAEILIPEFHDELKNACIAYLFKEKSSSRGRVPAAKAAKLGARDVHLSSYEFVIVVLWERWKKMDLVTRVALVDHELEHCGVDDNGNFTMLEHDIEEFNTTVQRWGAWEPGLVEFFQAAGSQVDMFQAAKEQTTEPSSAPPAVQLAK